MTGNPQRPRISIIVAARDEEDRIAACLRSCQWADERIVVVDAATRDGTENVARRWATKVFVRPWEGFARTKARAIEDAACDWIFWLDADEEVNPQLADAIRRAIDDPSGRVAFAVRRRNHYLGRVVSRGAWSNDRSVRLFRPGEARFTDRLVHEGIETDGATGLLDGYLDHHSYRNLRHHWEKMGAFARLWAEQARRDGKRAHAWDLVLRPALRFVKGYWLKRGFLDGSAGLVLAFMDAVYVGLKYACLIEMLRAAPPANSGREERS